MATSYPGGLDSLPRPTASTAMNATGFEGHAVIDNISDAIEAIQAELGTDPAGALATIKARLEGYETALANPVGWWESGVYYINALHSATATILNTAANRIYYAAWWCPRSVTADRILVEVTTLQASANARLGIYNTSATTGGPGSLVLDCGEIDCSTTGLKTLTISQSLVGGTLYWLALLNETASVDYRAAAADSARAIGMTPNNGDSTGRTTPSEACTYTSGFPATAAAWAGMTVGTNQPPLFKLRRT